MGSEDAGSGRILLGSTSPFSTGIQRMSIYETVSHFYVVGANVNKSCFRILKIDRTEPRTLTILDDGITYGEREVQNLLACLNHGNLQKRADRKGLQLLQSGWALAGFIRFTEGYYMVVVTKRLRVAMVGYHSIYKVEEAELIPLEHSSTRKPSAREQQYVRIFQSIDFKDNFYYSYTYDVTSTVQSNYEQSLTSERSTPSMKYVWNQHLLRDFKQQVQPLWIVYFVHGFISQANLSVFGRPIFVTLICRRSNRFAGTRFLKRGSDESGHVANEIETEQVVADEHFRSRLTSFVQLRGSVPGYWSQENSKMVPKPPIVVNRPDPFAESAASHFDAVLRRYSWPVICLNLVKKNERHRHESLLIDELKGAVSYLNQFLPFEMRLRYVGFDMARANKKGHALTALESIARKYIKRVGFFQSFEENALSAFRRVDPLYDSMQNLSRNGGANKAAAPDGSTCMVKQTGIMRTNCVDCIDRTNTAQFVMGKIALGFQLYALGIIDVPHVAYDCVASTLLEDLFEDAGNTIARQYGGSQMVHRLQSYRRRAWADHWKDSLQTFSRYYSNTFGDFDKQAAINLFLGIFEPTETAGEDLWNLMSDVYLHHPTLRAPLSVLQEIAEEISDAARPSESSGADKPQPQTAELAQEFVEKGEEERQTSNSDAGTEKVQDDVVNSFGQPDADADTNAENLSDDAGIVHEEHDSASSEKYTSLDSLSEMYRPWEFSWLRYHFRMQMPHTARDYARALRECDSSAFAVPDRLRAPTPTVLPGSAVVHSSSSSVTEHFSDNALAPAAAATVAQSPTLSSIQVAGDDVMGSQTDLSGRKNSVADIHKNGEKTHRRPESSLVSRGSRHSSVGQFLASHSAALFGRSGSSISVREEDEETLEKGTTHTFGTIAALDGNVAESTTDDGSDGEEADSSDDGFDDGDDNNGDDFDSDEFDEEDEALACLRAQREHLRTNLSSAGSSTNVFKPVLPRNKSRRKSSQNVADFGLKKVDIQHLPVEQRLKQLITTPSNEDIILIDRPMLYDYNPPISAIDLRKYENFAALNKMECLQRRKAEKFTNENTPPATVLQPTRCLAAYFQHMREHWEYIASTRLADKRQERKLSSAATQRAAETSPVTRRRPHLPSQPDVALYQRSELSDLTSVQAVSSGVAVSPGKAPTFFYRDGKVSLNPAVQAKRDELIRRNGESFDERPLLSLLSRNAADAVALMRASVHEITPLCDYSAYGSSRQVQLKPVDEKALDIYRKAAKLAASGVNMLNEYSQNSGDV